MTRKRYGVALGLALQAVIAAGRIQADVAIEGTSLLLRDGDDPARRRIVFQSIDSRITLDASTGAPLPDGATLHVFNPLTGEAQCIDLPAGHWTAAGSGRTYVYRDGGLAAGPVRSALAKAGRLKVVAKGAAIAFTLDETSQGEVDVDFVAGAGPRHCARFGAAVADRTGIFLARHAAASGCLAVPEPCPDVIEGRER
jgi:hypothetical protein